MAKKLKAKVVDEVEVVKEPKSTDELAILKRMVEKESLPLK